MPFGWERPSHYLRTICISVRRTHLELSPTVVHRVHDADDAHHGESSDRRSSKKAFLRPKLKRQIVAESLAPGASVAIGRNNWLFAGSLRAGQARRCGDEPNSLCQTQRA